MDQLGLLPDLRDRKVPLLHSFAQDVLKEVAETAYVVCELGEGCRRKDRAHGRSGRQMPAAEVLHLGPNVQGQTVYGVIEPVQRLLELHEEAFRFD
jgi:hypothetical protein